MRHNFLWNSIEASGFQLFFSPWVDVPQIWGHNSETKAQMKKTKNTWTTSFGHSIRRNQHCINLRSHLGLAASFVLTNYKNIILDILWFDRVTKVIYEGLSNYEKTPNASPSSLFGTLMMLKAACINNDDSPRGRISILLGRHIKQFHI